MLQGKSKDIIILVIVLFISIFVFLNRDLLKQMGYFGYIGVFFLCFISNLTVMLPAPSLMVVVAYSQILSPVIVAIVGALGTTLGEISGYFFGEAMTNLTPRWKKWFERISTYIHNANLMVFIFAILPLPIFDLAGIYAGSRKMKLKNFIIACYFGKFLKMLFYCVFVTEIVQLYLYKG